ncbi:MAG: FecR family protein [Flagellimonas sp.]
MEQNNLQDEKPKPCPMTEQEKMDLRERIFHSIQVHRKRKRRIHYFVGIAASIGLLVGFGNFYYSPGQQDETITDFVNTSKQVAQPDSEQIVLVLGGGEDVKIDDEITEVQYSGNGQKVTIGNTKSIDQKINDTDKPIYNTLFVPFGKRTKLMLSDGSLVWLNSGSKLIYPARFKGDKREVYIEGEAIFEVAHNGDRPFFVISENQMVKVLGTIFGVSSYTDENAISTILKSGSVEISYYKNTVNAEPMEKMRITPGTRASFHKENKSIISEKVDVDSHFSWKEGFLVFKKDDLGYIMKRISRYYNIKIKIADEVPLEETFSGYLDLNEDVESVLESITESTNVNYEFTNNNEVLIN